MSGRLLADLSTGIGPHGGMPFSMTRAVGPLPERRGSDPCGGGSRSEAWRGYLAPQKNEVRRRLLFRILLLPLCYKIKEIRVMANLRDLKKEIDYRLEEIVFDCDMAICFQPSKQEEIFKVMEEAVGVRNALYVKVNNPAEPHQSLARAQALCRSAFRNGCGLRRTFREAQRHQQIAVATACPKQGGNLPFGDSRLFYWEGFIP